MLRKRGPEREGRQPELKMSSFQERVERKCKLFWPGSGSRKGREGKGREEKGREGKGGERK